MSRQAARVRACYTFDPMQRVLIVVGLAILAVGIAWPFLVRIGIGRLPGDILIRRGGFTLYVPIVTCILVSAVLTLLLWIARR
jgi:hypothetical protein